MILVVTGVFLTFFFAADTRPVTYQGPYPPLKGADVSAAFDSVMRLSFEVRAGLLMRQIHHWTAVVFVAAIVVHVCRIFFTGAFRRPREINWLVGVGLLLLALVAGLTGYSLPDDLLSGTGLRITDAVVTSIPFIGPWLAYLIFGFVVCRLVVASEPSRSRFAPNAARPGKNSQHTGSRSAPRPADLLCYSIGHNARLLTVRWVCEPASLMMLPFLVPVRRQTHHRVARARAASQPTPTTP